MKFLGFLFITLLTARCVAAPDSRAKELDWSSKDIHVETVENEVQITLHTQGIAGKRIVLTNVQRFGGQAEATLTWQIVQNFQESFRHIEPFDVRWTLSKDEFQKLKSERTFYILRLDDAILHREAVNEIKANWQIH